MENKIEYIEERRQERNKKLREFINTLESFPDYSRSYWINKLVKQGYITEATAGRLLMSMQLV